MSLELIFRVCGPGVSEDGDTSFSNIAYISISLTGNRDCDKAGRWGLPPATLPRAGGSLCISAHFFSSLIYLIYLSIHPPIHPSIYLPICLSVYLSIYVSIDPSIHLSAYLSPISIIWLYVHFVVSNSLQSLGLWPARLLCQRNFPGNNTGVGCHFFLQGIFPTQVSNPGLLHCRLMIYHSAAWEALIIYIVILSSRKFLSK